MSVLLTILKILGILLLVILGLVLFLLLIVLLVPIRYRALGTMQNGEKPELMAAVTWLYPAVSVKAVYSEKLDFSLKFLGITIYPKKKNENSDETDEKIADTEISAEQHQINPESALKEEQKTLKTSGNSVEGNKKDPQIHDETDRTDSFNENSSSGFVDKLQALRTKAEFYMEILTADDTHSFVGKVFQTLLKILKSISPRNIKANVTVGFDDPAMTGNILAVHGMLYPWYGENVHINADFDRKVLEGEFSLKGHIRSVSLLYHILRLILDRRFHKLLSQLKKGGKTDDRK